MEREITERYGRAGRAAMDAHRMIVVLRYIVMLVLAIQVSVVWLDGGAHAQGANSAGAMGREIVRIPRGLEPGVIVVSLADRRLYQVLSVGRAVSYPVATPRDKDMWIGVETITAKRKLPSWRPTPTMLRENPRLPTYVPGGHKFNPMGARALHLGQTLYRIHGTDAPWLIGENVSKGCIRMHDAHVIELFDNTEIGTRVLVINESINDAAVGMHVHGVRPIVRDQHRS